MTEDHARLFVDEFRRETMRLSHTATSRDQQSTERLATVTREIDNLAANMFTGAASPTLLRLLADQEAENALLEQRLSAQATSRPAATIPLHPDLHRLFREKIAEQREALDEETIHGGAGEILSM
ncbi:hypothetical protein Q5H91_15545, partial [Sphingomonas sp. KR1UV-12]